MILKSTTSSSLILENMWASVGLAHESIIPTDQNQVIKELGFRNHEQWLQGNDIKSAKGRFLTSPLPHRPVHLVGVGGGGGAAEQVSVVPGSQEVVSFGSMNQHPGL